ncbi:hypothetical protein HM1_1930 [Heliomicrobium modesticaldum Ice1]|uniref:Uncharacterized protein n=1 Tax=Heliobacterium modesticaldum (strain ATCC 51547 / Ice1) TaxID=498761 RepID=B0TFQ8_HELMI|nr:hypothetical protein HM1_1930 [Heliomicrobium modesticaldum Ice1]
MLWITRQSRSILYFKPDSPFLLKWREFFRAQAGFIRLITKIKADE